MEFYETLVKNLEKDVEDLEQLKATPLLSGGNIWDEELRFLKNQRDFMKLFLNALHVVERYEAETGHIISEGLSDIPATFRTMRFESQMRLIKKIAEAKKALKALDLKECSIIQLDSARQQLGYARQEIIRKMNEMGFWGKAAVWLWRI